MKQTIGFWTRAGEPQRVQPSVEATKENLESSREEVIVWSGGHQSKSLINITAQIIEALKAAPFKRGVTYKEIAERYNCKPGFVFKIRMELIKKQ